MIFQNLIQFLITLLSVKLPFSSSIAAFYGAPNPSIGLIFSFVIYYRVCDSLLKYGLAGVSRRLYIKIDSIFEGIYLALTQLFTPRLRR